MLKTRIALCAHFGNMPGFLRSGHILLGALHALHAGELMDAYMHVGKLTGAYDSHHHLSVSITVNIDHLFYHDGVLVLIIYFIYSLNLLSKLYGLNVCCNLSVLVHVMLCFQGHCSMRWVSIRICAIEISVLLNYVNMEQLAFIALINITHLFLVLQYQAFLFIHNCHNVLSINELCQY